MTSPKWGNCDRCGKPSECCRYSIEVLDHDAPDVCQSCKDEWDAKVTALLNEFMRKSQEQRNTV